jgi:hypothetical protein
MEDNFCVVFVSNKKYFHKFKKTCTELITDGKYKGDICLIVSDDLYYDKDLDCKFIKDNNIIIKKFKKINIPDIKYECSAHIEKVDGCIMKFNLFNTYFKKWKYILYLDCGMNILSDINQILNEATDNTLLAHSDAYPEYKWKLSGQLNKTKYDYIFNKLNNLYNLNIDYFQSGIMLYHTNIIKKDTFSEIVKLLNEFPIGITNDQCYLSIYFIIIKNVWKQIPLKNSKTNFYDYMSRKENDNKYIIVKVKNW